MPKPTFFARHAMVILVAIFFLVPFGLRGARIALSGMKNDVKDWLPKDLDETKDLEEFRQYFLNEQFVLVSWDGCFGGASDQRYQMFLGKLEPEVAPSAQKASETTEAGSESPVENEPHTVATRYLHRDDDFIGNQLGLYFTGDWHENWGDSREKWLKGRRPGQESTNAQCWYYLTPEGDLFRWEQVDAPAASITRFFYRAFVSKKVTGTLVHSFGPVDGSWYHADPRRVRASLFKTVTAGPDVLESLIGEGGELSSSEELRREAQRRLSGVLFGPDDKTTCMVLTLTDAARKNLHLVCGRGMLGKPRGRLYEIAAESNIRETELRMGGPPIDNVAIDEEGSITLVRLAGYSLMLGLGLSYLCFRSISATIMVFFVGGISAVASIAMVWWCGSSMDAIVMAMPSMIYVLGLSGAAHIMNYYYDAVEHSGYAGAPERAVAQGWKPAFLCEATTALGLLTLVTSELVPIRKFGIFSAIGVMIMFVIMLTYLPAALQIWPQKRRKRKTEGEVSWLEGSLAGVWRVLGSWIIRHHGAVAIGCTLLIAVAGYGIVHMRTSVNLLKMFNSGAKIIKDYEWLEANIGKLVPMEIVLRVPKDQQCPASGELARLQEELAGETITAERKAEIETALHEAQFQLTFLERMELANRVQLAIEQEFGDDGRQVVGRALSAATFVRPLPKAAGGGSARLTRTSTSGRLEAHRDNFLHSDYLRIKEDDQTELWRVSLRLGATSGVDYGAFVSNLQQTVEPIVAAQHRRQEVLRRLTEYRMSHGESDKPLANSRVLLVGAPAAPPEGQNLPKPELATPVDQNKIFVRTLRDLLTISRFKLDVLAVDAKLPPDMEQSLAGYDCVIVVGDVPGLTARRCERAARVMVDARDHATLLAASRQTAWQRDPAGVAAVYTGVVPIVYKAQRMLLDSLVQSTFWSIITITPLLMWIARSVSAGALAMLPNVLPIVMVFGGMGWLGIDVDVGAMMTASIALGVAVDDTIHYLNWFRAELDRLGDRNQAILAAYQHCATPTLQAATISGLGLSVFAMSTFTPTQAFGILMLVILWLGAVAELIYFPALLAGPLGSVFKPRTPVLAENSAEQARVTPLPRQPQLQILRVDEATDRLRIAIVNGDGEHSPAHAPHGGKAEQPRLARHDEPRGRS